MREIAIVIPTRNRPHFLAELLDSIHIATTVDHSVYFLPEQDDEPTLTALEDLADCEVLSGSYGSYTSAANAGVALTPEPYFLVANDDVIFHAGWDTAALALMADPIRVVGINQGNGRTDCFFLVDRRYLAEQSGVCDEPDTFYHEGYHSQYCDTEFYEVAKRRGVWADAPDALIEHRHWTLGKSQMDANYEVAVASGGPDQALFSSRRHQWA